MPTNTLCQQCVKSYKYQEVLIIMKRSRNQKRTGLALKFGKYSDRVRMSWHYICVLVDLFNREIIGYSAGKNKDVALVSKAFFRINIHLEKIQIFHTNRGNEFKNKALDDTLKTFCIQRSLSMKGCPYDNSVAEAMFKIIKTE